MGVESAHLLVGLDTVSLFLGWRVPRWRPIFLYRQDACRMCHTLRHGTIQTCLETCRCMPTSSGGMQATLYNLAAASTLCRTGTSGVEQRGRGRACGAAATAGAGGARRARRGSCHEAEADAGSAAGG
eukprot:364111-Chlamydomonas_euryale.AAC.24